MDDFTDQPKPTQIHITEHPAQEPTAPTLPQPRSLGAKNDLLSYILVVLGVLVLTVFMAVIGGWVLVSVTAVVIVLGLIHYWTWGRRLSRQVAEEQARLFRQQLELDRDHLSEVERPRHY
jgi:Flp pilus assembly protein TadB